MSERNRLEVKVLGTAFTLRWGPRITAAQREGMREAWSRCTAESMDAPSTEPPEPVPPTSALPFTAVLVHSSKLPNGGTCQLAASSFERLAEYITSELTVAAILERAGELTMLHACGIANPDSGTVIALVAKSGTGKTTAVSILAKTLGYVTDETVAIAPDRGVIPYPKPLSVKQIDAGAAKMQVGPDELGLEECPEELRLGAIVLLNRSDEFAGEVPALRRVPLADAVLALIPDSSSQAKVIRPLQSLCELIDSVGGVWRVDYSEAEDLAEALDPLFSLESGGSSRSNWLAPAAIYIAGALPPGCYLRSAPEDAVQIDDDLILLRNTEVVRLSGIAPAIWDLAGRPVTMQELVGGLEVRHGLPDGYQAHIEAALEKLVSRGILTVGTPSVESCQQRR